MIVGALSGWLVNRHWRSNFFESCDSISAELQLLANVLFHQSGRLQKIQWSKEFNFDVLERCSSGVFLSIYNISIRKAHRGKDLGYRYLQHLFQSLHGQWTISVIVPGLIRCKLEGEERKRKLNHQCQLFARCGYKFLPVETNTPYWYLIPTELKSRSKVDVQNVGDMHNSNDHWDEYRNSLSSIYSTACLMEARCL